MKVTAAISLMNIPNMPPFMPASVLYPPHLSKGQIRTSVASQGFCVYLLTSFWGGVIRQCFPSLKTHHALCEEHIDIYVSLW
ncbi:hypothetical protein TcWFU_005407 [Taenia crassiceps]|uniref:Uncharacterized protein n=1 Tax=Taenia crassiceps TaxID=6207 RepID=A0ABR4QMU2_9CEST